MLRRFRGTSSGDSSRVHSLKIGPRLRIVLAAAGPDTCLVAYTSADDETLVRAIVDRRAASLPHAHSGVPQHPSGAFSSGPSGLGGLGGGRNERGPMHIIDPALGHHGPEDGGDFGAPRASFFVAQVEDEFSGLSPVKARDREDTTIGAIPPLLPLAPKPPPGPRPPRERPGRNI